MAEHLDILHPSKLSTCQVTTITELQKGNEQALELNTRIQQQNAAPVGFPAFVREGFNVKVRGCSGSGG